MVASYIAKNKFVKIIPKIDLKFGKFLLKNSIPFALNIIAIAIFIRIDIVMLSLFKGDAVVGWYSVAHSLVYGLLAISFTYGIVIFPVMSQLYDQKHYLKLMFEKSFKFFLIIGVGIGIVGFVLAEDIILQIYGTEFLPSIAILKVMIWVCIFLFFRYIYITMLGAIDKQTICAKILISMALLNVVANLLLIPPFSYMGAVIATLITEIYGVCIGFYFVYRYIPGIVIRNQIPKLLISTPLFIIGIVILNKYGLNNIFFAIPIYLCLYMFVLFLLRVFDKEELELLKSAFKIKNAETNSD